MFKQHANQKEGPTSTEICEAAFQDADDFVSLYNIPVDPKALAEDFLARV